MKIVKQAFLTCAAALCLLPGPAIQPATAWVTSAEENGRLAATDAFGIVGGGKLHVVRTNTSVTDAVVSRGILTTAYWNIGGSPTLTPIAAPLSAGTAVLYGQTIRGNVGGEWPYAKSGTPSHEPIGSAGVGMFRSASFNGLTFQGTATGGSLQNGITSAGDNITTRNAPVAGGNADLHNSMTFLLGSLAQDFAGKPISSIVLQHGMNATASVRATNPMPEGKTYAMLIAGLGLMGFVARRRRAASRLQDE